MKFKKFFGSRACEFSINIATGNRVAGGTRRTWSELAELAKWQSFVRQTFLQLAAAFVWPFTLTFCITAGQDGNGRRSPAINNFYYTLGDVDIFNAFREPFVFNGLSRKRAPATSQTDKHTTRRRMQHTHKHLLFI